MHLQALLYEYLIINNNERNYIFHGETAIDLSKQIMS